MALGKQIRAIAVNYEPPPQTAAPPPLPTAPLLIQYLWRRRWVWTLTSADTLAAIVHLLGRARHADGFFLVYSSSTCSVFLKVWLSLRSRVILHILTFIMSLYRKYLSACLLRTRRPVSSRV